MDVSGDRGSNRDDGGWMDASRRGALACHRLVGWVFWDPRGVANYAATGVPDGLGYYIASRAAPIAAAGPDAVVAAFGSIHPAYVSFAMDTCLANSSFEAAARARDEAVVAGLHSFVPDVVEGLASMCGMLWDAVDSLPQSGRVLFAAHRSMPRPDDELLSAWSAVNCIREWRGDTHWAIQTAEGLSCTASGVLDGAWRRYTDDWLPRSRGADDEMMHAAMEELTARGFATDGAVNAAGVEYRNDLEDRLDRLTIAPWRALGTKGTERFLSVVEPAGERLMARVDATAGPSWMPAGRDRPLDR